MTSYRLVSFKLCPFVQRAVLVLDEKNIPYEIEYIDLANKPDWFLEMSPTGKVPLLIVDGEHKVFESSVIAEFIDDTTSPRMHPEDPLERARHRMWIEYGSGLNIDVYQLTRAESRDKALAIADCLRGKLQQLEPEILGPLFEGDSFCLVDASLAPALLRASWLEEMAAELDLFNKTPKVQTWRDTLLQRPSIKHYLGGELEELFKSSIDKLESNWLGARP